MSTASRINVLVTGYGNIGTPILRAMTNPHFSSRISPFVLIRPASLTDPSKKQAIDQVRAMNGVTIVEGDLESDVATLTALLQKAAIRTVVSVVSGYQIERQLPLVEAAKAAGVRHFIPSEFGVDTEATPVDGMWGPFLKPKIAVQKALKEAGMDYTLLFVGLFTEFFVLYPIAGVDLQNGAIAAPGSWETKVSTTSLEEAGWLTAVAVVEPRARNARLYSGDTVTYKQLADMLDTARGKPLQRSIRTAADAKAEVDKDPNDLSLFPARLVCTLIDGKGTWWPASRNYSVQYQTEHKPLPLADWIRANVRPAAR